jgi:tetratricopeptide (TPR) repeat protein
MLRRVHCLVAALATIAAFDTATPLAAAITYPDTGLFAPVAKQWQARTSRAGGFAGRASIEAALEAGRIHPIHLIRTRKRPPNRLDDVVHARAWIALVGLGSLRPILARIAALPRPNEDERWVHYQGLFAYDDAARVDSLTRARLGTTLGGTPEWLAAGKLAYDILDYSRADSCFGNALAAVTATRGMGATSGTLAPAKARSAALTGQALVLQKRREWDGSLAKLTEALEQYATPEALNALVETLVRLGRTDEAISAAQWAARFNPYSDAAHYSLGNGYTRKSYTELMAAYPGAFANAEGRRRLARADSLLAAGKRREARAAYERVTPANRPWADALVRLASLDFEDGRFGEARERCFAALRICPEYGRAHAELAKALEAQRFAADVHRPDYERRFAAAAMPKIEGIERYVTNWASLSPRHQKRVALSIAPWKQFIPVLIEGGATHYIKPLHQLLSEAPGLETLKDQRIGYDSRLWDDVRGAGGYHTVTGIEDVERTIFDRYNTVLHEMTHQVHAVLTANQGREIQELYRRAKARDDSTRNGFLSRYAGGSVWEYFAEGANAIESPKRDAYDPREVVRERLERMDSDLETHVKELFALDDVSASYPVAYVNAGDDRVSRGKVDEALGFYRKALARAPHEETALQSLTNALNLGNRRAAMVAAADSALAIHPASGGIVTAAASAYWHGGRPLEDALALLERSRPLVRREDRYQVDLARGGLAWNRGDASAALAAYDSVLAYQSDHPEGMWGRASSLALAAKWDESFAMYDRAVRMRTGIVALRCDYARDLLRAGRIAAARAQLDEAKLLDAEHPVAEALRGWAALVGNEATAAKRHAEQAIHWGAWCDLAWIVLGRAERALSNSAAADRALARVRERIAENAPPDYVYRPKLATWESVHELPAVERELLR